MIKVSPISPVLDCGNVLRAHRLIVLESVGQVAIPSPLLGNFADLSYLKEQIMPHICWPELISE